jgi:hypothetical protein
MATKIKPLLKTKIEAIDLKTTMNGQDKQGKFLVSSTFNGMVYKGKGDSQRLATLDMQRKINDDAIHDKIPVGR